MSKSKDLKSISREQKIQNAKNFCLKAIARMEYVINKDINRVTKGYTKQLKFLDIMAVKIHKESSPNSLWKLICKIDDEMSNSVETGENNDRIDKIIDEMLDLQILRDQEDVETVDS